MNNITTYQFTAINGCKSHNSQATPQKRKISNLMSYKMLLLLFFGCTLLSSSIGWAQTLLTEQFNYTPNATNGLAIQSSGAWRVVNTGDSVLVESGNLNYTGLLTSSGNRITYGGAGTDYYTPFTSQTTGTVYSSFLLNISSLGSLNATGGYTIGFLDGTASAFAATVWLRLSGSNFNIGINPRTTTLNTSWLPGALSINTTYLVVIANKIVNGLANDSVKIWLNPTSFSGIEPTANATVVNGGTDLTSIQRVFLRQDATAATPGVLILDELRVGTTWASVTPSSNPNLAITGTTSHGTLCVGTPGASIQYTINNSGGAASGVTVTSNNAQFVVSNAPASIAANGSANYNVIFTPSGAGAQSAIITVGSTTSGSNSPTSNLSGTGTAVVSPVVSSDPAVGITSNTASLVGTVTILGICPSTTEKGFVYAQTSVNNNPLVGGTGVVKEIVAGVATGTYGAGLTSLPASTGYSYKAYVYDNAVYTYGAVITFSTDAPPASVITVNGTLSALTTVYGTASSTTSFTVSGSGLTEDITVEAPLGFEISSGASYFSALTLTQTGGVVNATTINVRLTSATPVGTYSGSITLTSAGSNDPTVVIPSSSITTKALTVTATANDKIYDGNTNATITGTLNGVVNGDVVTFNGVGTFASANVNVGPPISVTSTVSSIGGANASNYTLVQPTGLSANITKANQTIIFNTLPVKTFTSAPFKLTATASSGLVISYASLNTSVAMVSNDTVFIVGVGTASIVASQVGNGNYNAAPDLAHTLTVNKATQTISFAAIPTKTTADAPLKLTASASSGLPVSYASSNPLVATISNDTLFFVGVGTSIITASQAGNANYLAAPDSSRTVTVSYPVIAGWDFFGQSSPATFAATTFNTNLSSSHLITRGAGAVSSAASNSFRTTGFQNNGISVANTDYFQVTLSATTSKLVSLTSINANFAGTTSFAASPGVNSQFAFSLNGTTFTLIGTPAITIGTPASLPQLDVSAIAALQNVPTGTTITLRYYASGQTTTGGWGFISNTAVVNGLGISGFFTNAPTITTTSVSGSSFCVTSTDNTPVNVNYTTTGTFAAGNIFTAQLSNGSGSFASPLNIGSSAVNNGVVNALLPAGLVADTAYRIRIISSNPTIVGTNNGTNIIVHTIAAVSASNSGPICAGQQLNLFASGGTSFTWSGPNSFSSSVQNPVIVTTVIADSGSFTVIVNNGVCQDTTTTLAQVQDCGCVPPTITAVVDSVDCFNTATGAINLSVTGAIAPYSYSWSNGATTEDVSGLSAGNYSVIVTDNVSCRDTAFITVYQPAVLNLSLAAVNPSCQGQSSGSINATVSGGTLPYLYSWSNAATSEDITGLSAGTYVLTVTDFHGCTAIHSSTLTDPPAFNISIVGTPPTCVGSANGHINLTASNDTAVNTNNPGLLISEFLANPAGSDSPFEWAEFIATKNINFSTTPYTVVFANNGPATTKGWVQGGIAGATSNSTYAFQINTGIVNPGDIVYVGGSSMTPTGTKLRVINTGTVGGDGGIGSPNTTGVLGNGGSADAIGVFNLPVLSLDSNSIPVDAIFYGTSAGTAIVNAGANGYVLPTNDRYSGGHLQTGSFLAPDPGANFISATGSYNLNSGTYTTRTWSTAASFSNNVSVISLVSTNSYLWSNGATTQNISGLTAGTYSVIATSPAGCKDTATVTLSPTVSINLSFSVTQPQCFGGTNGAVDLTVSNGTAPFTYIWSNSETTEDLTAAISANTYIVTVTDSVGCVQTGSVIVGQPAELTITDIIAIDATCAGASDGSIDITVTGGVGPYTYAWSNDGETVFATTEDITNKPANIYFINITDAHGCLSGGLTFINEPAPILITSFTPTSGAAGDTIVISGSGFTPTTQVTVNTTAVTSFTINSDTQITAIIGAGTTTGLITVTAAPGCTGISGTSFTVNGGGVVLTLKFFIEGFYVSPGTMQPVLFNADNNYPEPLHCDSVLIELHDASPSYNLVASVLTVVNIYGDDTLSLPDSLLNGSYYIVIKHRNAIETWSKVPVTIGTSTVYDFTTSVSPRPVNNGVIPSNNLRIQGSNNNSIKDDLH